jgi:hypothetical protein
MAKDVLLILVDHRNDAAVQVQKVLTGWGCLIKTRLGLHADVLDNCSEQGLIFLELVGEEEKHAELERKLNLVSGVSAKLVKMEIDS